MSFEIQDTLIIINSANRADKVITHKLFPKNTIDWKIVVPADQYKEYSKNYWPRVEAVDDEVPPYLPSQRQWCVEQFQNNYKYIWFMDDDLTFFVRTIELKLEKAGVPDIAYMIHEMRNQLNKFSMVGISTRLGNNRVTENYADTTRVTRCYAFSTEAFKDVGATFAPFEPFVAEDFHMTLCFLNKGYNNRVIYNYAQEDVGSNATGGCSVYRTPEIQAKTSHWMAENHPEVRVKVKKAKAWKGFGDTRVDMVVQWKKAYKPKKSNKSRWLIGQKG
jgi:hypothetical protein